VCVLLPANATPVRASTMPPTASSRLATGDAPAETRPADDRERFAAREPELGRLVRADDVEVNPLAGAGAGGVRRRDHVLPFPRRGEPDGADDAAATRRGIPPAAEHRRRRAGSADDRKLVGARGAL